MQNQRPSEKGIRDDNLGIFPAFLRASTPFRHGKDAEDDLSIIGYGWVR